MKRSNLSPSKKATTEDAQNLFKTLSSFYHNENIYIEDKKDLIYYFLRYVINHRLSLLPIGRKLTISLRNQAAIDALTSQQRIVRYYETHYGNQCAQMLDFIFGRGGWQHVIHDQNLYNPNN